MKYKIELMKDSKRISIVRITNNIYQTIKLIMILGYIVIDYKVEV